MSHQSCHSLFFRAFDVGFDNLTCLLYPIGFVFLSPNTKQVRFLHFLRHHKTDSRVNRIASKLKSQPAMLVLLLKDLRILSSFPIRYQLCRTRYNGLGKVVLTKNNVTTPEGNFSSSLFEPQLKQKHYFTFQRSLYTKTV